MDNQLDYNPNYAAETLNLSITQYKQLAKMFIDRFNAYMNQLNICIQKNDVNGLAHEAHKLKGVTANLRMTMLAKIAAEIEIAALKGSIADGKAMLNELVTEYEKINALLA